MRVNRSVRIGLLLVVAALLLFGLYRVFSSRLNPPLPGRNEVATNDTGNGLQKVGYSSNQYAWLTRTVPDRTIITPDMLVMKPSADGRPVDRDTFITNINQEALGYVTNRPIPAGQPLRKEFLLGHISQVGIAAVLQPDRRALVVPIGNKPAFHPIVHIGDYVDVTVAADGQEARTIVQNVRVLAVDVFVKDYPPTSVAPRGYYKAPSRGASQEPPVTEVNPAGTPVPTGGPTPTPPPQGPPPVPTPALTLEVTPLEANAIILAESANALIDFLIRPAVPTTIGPAPVGTAMPARLVSADVIKSQILPYASAKVKSGGTSTTTSNNRNAGGGGGASGGIRRRGSGGGGTFIPDAGMPPWPQQSGGGTTTVPPLPVEPKTYNIPIYADGHLLRVDTVKKPDAPAQPQY